MLSQILRVMIGIPAGQHRLDIAPPVETVAIPAFLLVGLFCVVVVIIAIAVAVILTIRKKNKAEKEDAS